MIRGLLFPIAAGLLALAGAGACGRMAPAGAPIPVEASAADRVALTGKWTGSYRLEGNAGYGRISFELPAGADSARGQVEMDFSPALRLYGRSPEGRELDPQPCTTLDISVVRVATDSVHGTLAGYWNPSCDCRTRAVFEGGLAGGRIDGVVSVMLESGDSVLAKGRWTVRRR